MKQQFRLLLGIALAVLMMSCTGTQNKSKILDTTVKTQYGTIKGTVNESETVAMFKGIPFAAPPVGDLRWREPQPPEAWEGVRDASKFGANPIQVNNRRLPWTDEFMIKGESSEDCLFLNVWTPAKSVSDKLPVMVWIFGGGLQEGSGSIDAYDGEELAKKGIIVVSINYRVGLMGFFAHPELTAESIHKSSGNYGFLDQLAALKWINANITEFGGDPQRVTICGQSAGSRSVHALTASPLAKGLFRGAIANSGASMDRFTSFGTLADAEKNGLEFAKTKGASTVAQLRAMSAADLIANSPRFGACIDGYYLPEDMVSIFKNGQQNDVPTMTGMVADEGSSSEDYGKGTKADYIEKAKKNYGAKADEFLSLYPVNSDADVASMSIEAARENGRIATYKWAIFRGTTAKTPVYTYYFERGIPWPEHPEFGAFHTSDIPRFFNNLKKLDRPWTDEDRVLADKASSYWVNFVTNGDPNGAGLPVWPVFDANKMETLKLNAVIEPITIANENRVKFFMDL
jgi:para-nitrobenzyl esterase